MKPTSGFYANAFDLIRLLAALQVLFGHIYIHYELKNVSDVFYPLLTISQYFPGRGVIVFFAVSGFLAMGSIEKARGLKEYAKKKFLRIYPELIVCFILNSIYYFWMVRCPRGDTRLCKICVHSVNDFSILYGRLVARLWRWYAERSLMDDYGYYTILCRDLFCEGLDEIKKCETMGLLDFDCCYDVHHYKQQ